MNRKVLKLLILCTAIMYGHLYYLVQKEISQYQAAEAFESCRKKRKSVLTCKKETTDANANTTTSTN